MTFMMYKILKLPFWIYNKKRAQDLNWDLELLYYLTLYSEDLHI